MKIAAENIYNERLRRIGTADDYRMNVDGSSIPVYFIAKLTNETGEFNIHDLTFAIMGGKLNNPLNFSGKAIPIANGIEIGLFDKKGHYDIIFPSLKNNIEINLFSSSSNIIDYETRTKEVLRAQFFEKHEIIISTNHYRGIYIKIQDDLSDLSWFEAVLNGNY